MNYPSLLAKFLSSDEARRRYDLSKENRKVLEGFAHWLNKNAAEKSVHPTVATVAAQEVNLDARNSG